MPKNNKNGFTRSCLFICRWILVYWLTRFFVVPVYADSLSEAPIEFNPAFLMGHEKIDLSVFNHPKQVLPGMYDLSIVLNGHEVGRSKLSIINQNQQSKVCLNQFVLELLNIRPEYRTKVDTVDECYTIENVLPGAYQALVFSDFLLKVSVPQAYLNKEYRGSVDESLWESGVDAGFVNYNMNYFNSTQKTADHRIRNDYYSVFLDTGVNLGLWQYRNHSSYSYTRTDSSWVTMSQYVQRPLKQWHSLLTVGDANTSGQYFDSVGFRGVQLKSDERMLPSSRQGFAPVVRGVARTNARVRVSQRGISIYETTVPAGAFVLEDLYPTGYGGDLDVDVFESDGTEQRFSVPFSSVAQLLRESASKYEFMLGEYRHPTLSQTPTVIQSTYALGVSNYVTAYGGLQLSSSDYYSGVLGTAWNTPIGAIGLDITGAIADLKEQGRQTGWSLKGSHSTVIDASQTFISLAAYRYSSRNYYSLSDSLLQNDYPSNQRLWRQKGRFELSINQPLGDYGGLFLSGSSSSYWDMPERDTQYQFSYSHHLENINFGISISRNKSMGVAAETQYMLSVGIPLGSGHQGYHALTSSVQYASGGTRQASVGVNGALSANNQGFYSLSSAYHRSSLNSGHVYSGSLGYYLTHAQVNASASQSRQFNQLSLSARGSAVLHPGGLTFGQYTHDAFAIIHAPHAEGAEVDNVLGGRIDKDGYAIVPNLNAYRQNTISLNPMGMNPKTELLGTSLQVVPYSGAVVQRTFNTRYGNKALIEVYLDDNRLPPLGTLVEDEAHQQVGMVGHAGVIYASGLPDQGKLQLVLNPKTQARCQINYVFNEEDLNKHIAQFRLPCLPVEIN